MFLNKPCEILSSFKRQNETKSDKKAQAVCSMLYISISARGYVRHIRLNARKLPSIYFKIIQKPNTIENSSARI